jgi:hypothetical protein
MQALACTKEVSQSVLTGCGVPGKTLATGLIHTPGQVMHPEP